MSYSHTLPAFLPAAPTPTQRERRNQAAIARSARAHALLKEQRAESVTKHLSPPRLPFSAMEPDQVVGSDAHRN